MKKFAGLYALLGLILLVILVSLLLRAPPEPRPGGGEVPADPAEVLPPPLPTVTRTQGPPGVEAELELTLLDAVTREPVEGATVELKEVRSGEGERGYGFTEEGNGVYRLSERPEDGLHALTATASGYECLRWDFTLTPRDRGLNAELRPLTDVVVVVEDPSGTPIPDAVVTLSTAGWGTFRCVHPTDADETVLLRPSYQGASDAEGTAVFTSLIPGEGYAVSVAADDKEPARVESIHVEPANPHIVKVVVDAGARIIGRIRDGEGAPGKGFTVICRRRHERRSGFVVMEHERSVLSRDDGYFELTRLSPGPKELEIHRTTRNRLETCVLQVTARRGKTHDCGLVGPTPLSEGGANLRIQVVEESGGALPGAEVNVMKDDPDPIDSAIMTDDSGSCAVLGLNPGLVTLGVHFARSEFLTETVKVRLEAGEEKELAVTLKKRDVSQYRKLIVRLRDGSSRPLSLSEKMTKGLRPYVESDEGEWVPQNWGAKSDEEGDYFEVTGVRPGSYRAMVVGDGLITRAESVFVEDPVSEVEVTLEDAIEVRGRLVDASSGEGVSGRVLKLLEARAAPSNRDRAHEVTSDAEGHFGLRAFGSWEERGLIEVRADAYKTKVVELHPGVGDVGDIGLSRGN